MARRLSIERRQKRYRQYAAHLRKQSRTRQAILYWWGPFVIASLILGLLGLTLFQRGMPWQRTEAPLYNRGGVYLQVASLRLVSATSDEIAEIVRVGNVRRRVDALTDEDVGISLQTPSVAPIPLGWGITPPMRMYYQVVPKRGGRSFPPLTVTEEPVQIPFAVRCDETLEAVAYVPKIASQTRLNVEPKHGRARFDVTLDEQGIPTTVLRIVPTGEETAYLRQLRMALEQTRGEGAAVGCVRITW